MTQEEKELLLLIDFCARLPYGVKITDGLHITTLKVKIDTAPATLAQFIHSKNLKYYLRPMSSMTEEEFGFLQEHLPYDFTRIYSGKFDLINDIHIGNSISIDDIAFLLECLNKWHFDYRGLISMGLVLEAPKEMYKTN